MLRLSLSRSAFAGFLPAALFLVLISAASCAGGAEGDAHADAGHEEHAEETHEGEDHAEGEAQSNVVLNDAGGYGEVITADGAMTTDQLIAAMDDVEEMPAKVSGTVTAACQMSGCWMKLPYGQEGEMRVAFKDYGFFVPKDLAGTTVVVEGIAKRTMVDVETLRHFAQDGGASEEEIAAITEPSVEIEFVANGVLPIEG